MPWEEETRQVQELVLHDLHDCHAYRLDGFSCIGFLVLANPGDALPDVRHLEEVAVEASLLHGPEDRLPLARLDEAHDLAHRIVEKRRIGTSCGAVAALVAGRRVLPALPLEATPESLRRSM